MLCYKEILMLQGKLAFVQNRAHGTSSRYKLATTNHHAHDFSIGKLALIQNIAHGISSRYKLATTNHHGQGFSIGKLATVSFPSSISMCGYARRK